MDKQPIINKENLININELSYHMDKNIKFYISNFQNKLVNFCKDTNEMQNEENFFKLSMSDQMKFNDCIENSTNKLKKDFLDLEKFYSNCKIICYQNTDKLTIDKSIDEYMKSTFKVLSPPHPCIRDCMNIYEDITGKYYKYMIDGMLFIYLYFFNFFL